MFVMTRDLAFGVGYMVKRKIFTEEFELFCDYLALNLSISILELNAR